MHAIGEGLIGLMSSDGVLEEKPLNISCRENKLWTVEVQLVVTQVVKRPLVILSPYL